MINITHEEKLEIFESKILRRIHGPVQDSNNEWRVRTNQEIEALMKEENIVRFIKSQKLACYGHVNRMEDNKNVKAIKKWNPSDRRSRGRAKTRWKDDVEADAMKITNWETGVEYKLAWKKNVEQAKTHPGL
jgi:competence protein ComGF